MPHNLPSGTVTFLFTDIEGSTKLLHELGAQRYAQSLAKHRRLLRAAFTAHRGVEVDTQGDAFFVAFGDARDALAAAREAQQAVAAEATHVRMGLHTGEPLLADDGYVGVDVHKAARICSAGHGGQILVSEQTKLAISDNDLHPLGVHRLKDLTAPEPLYQLGVNKFPPLKSLNQSNLPEQPTPFEGRERELTEVLNLLRRDRVRLVTLTGPGGSGKTRLALQAAAEMIEEKEHGVWWVGMQAVRDVDLVVPTIAVAVAGGGDVAAYVTNKRMLLLLDNLEQVVEAAPQLGDLLVSCPNLSLLVTSREPLHLAAEHVYPVPPFLENEAVAFFLTRARVRRPDFSGDGAVSVICRRLDYLPLALELAAARLTALSSRQLLNRLEQRLGLLTHGARDAPQRQRTLRDTIAWSYELLTLEEQRLFRRISVCGGGCSLEAAEQVAGADFDMLNSLVDKSLLRFDRERYTMLETIREYALDRLVDSGEASEIRRRHAQFFLGLAEGESLSAEAGYGRRHDVAIAEQDNFRAAIDWALAAGEAEVGIRVAVALENFWVVNDPFEGVRRFEALFERGGDLPPVLRARALRCYGGSSNMAGNHAQAQQAYEESLVLFRALGDERAVGVLLHRLGNNALLLRRLDLARELLEESLEIFHRVGSPRDEAQAIGSLGHLAHAQGDIEGAIELFEKSAVMVADLGFTWWHTGMLAALAECALELGRIDEAEARAREQLILLGEIPERQGVVYALAQLAWVAVEKGDVHRAGRLWGAVEAEESRGAIGQWESERDTFAAPVLGHPGEELERGLAEGRQLSLQAAIDEVLEESDETTEEGTSGATALL